MRKASHGTSQLAAVTASTADHGAYRRLTVALSVKMRSEWYMMCLCGRDGQKRLSILRARHECDVDSPEVPKQETDLMQPCGQTLPRLGWAKFGQLRSRCCSNSSDIWIKVSTVVVSKICTIALAVSVWVPP